MGKIFFILIFILSINPIHSNNEIRLDLIKDKFYYTRNVEAHLFHEEGILLKVCIYDDDFKLKKITSLNAENTMKIEEVKTSKNGMYSIYHLSLGESHNQRTEFKFQLEVGNGKKYQLAILLYDKALNIDSLPPKYEYNYKKGDIPILLYSNSHVNGNFLILNHSKEIIYKFERLTSFSTFLKALREGEFFLCENSKDNLLFKIKVSPR